MLLDFIVNFCILFTYAILTYIPFQNQLNLYIPSRKYHPILLGVLSAITGCILMLTSVKIFENVIVDGRMAVIALAGIFGGPLATIICGTIIGLFRMFMFGYSETALIAGYSTIVTGFVIGICIWKKPMTFQNTAYYFTDTIIQTSFVLAYLNNWKTSSIVPIAGFILYSIISYSIIFFSIKAVK